MHIACAANAKYLPHAAAMLHSVLNQPARTAPVIHFLHDVALPDSDVSRLREFVTGQGGEWRAHAIEPERLEGFPANARFSLEAWYRILLPELLPELPRVLYLDVDLIVLQPLDPLWDLDLDGCIVGAVTNPLYPFVGSGFVQELGLSSAGDYFNSGVLLMDLDCWRQQEVTRDLQTFVVDRGAAQPWPDQHALNAVLRDRWLKLPPIWNAQDIHFELKLSQLPHPASQVRQARREPRIVHFSAPYKPWDYLCKHPYRRAYYRHRAETPWPEFRLQGANWRNRLIRPLPRALMWKGMVRSRNAWRRLRALFG